MRSETTQMTSKALMANPTLSRRAFFSLTAVAGALHFLGSVHGGRILAFADDEGDMHFTIVVLSKEEIGVQVIDISRSYAAVGGAHVVVTSRFNEKTATADTSADGIAIINVKALSQQCAEEDPDEYSLHMGADVTVDGYRGFAVTSTFVIAGPQEGGEASGRAHIFLPTQPYDARTSDPYLRMACFDGSDMLHITSAIAKFEENTIDHLFEFQVACGAGANVSVAVYATEPGAAEAALFAGPVQATADAAGIASCSMTGAFVSQAAAGAAFECRFTVGSTTYRTELGLSITEPDIDLRGPYYAQNWSLSLGSGAQPDPDDPQTKTAETKGFYLGSYEKRKVYLPELPWGGDITVLGDLPWFPVDFVVDPRGGIGLSFRPATFSLFSKEKGSPAEGPNREKWLKSMKNPCGTFFDKRWGMIDKSIGNFEKARQNAKNAKRGLGGKMFASINLGVDFEVLVKAYFLDPKGEELKTWEGTGGACFTGILSGELGAVVSAGPVPLFVGWDFLLRISAAIEAGVQFTPAFKDPKWFFMDGAHGEGGFSVCIYLDSGLSAGLGIKGLANVFVRGYVIIPMAFTFQKRDGLPFPHKEISIQAGMQVGCQVLFFTFKSDTIVPFRKTLLDNWDEAALEDSENTGEGEAEALAGFFDNPPCAADGEDVLGYTTDAMLLKRAEVTARVNAQGVIHGYDVSGLALPNEEAIAAANRGMKDPFDANAQAYDARKGLRPNIEVAFGAPDANGEAADVFSDARVSVVVLGGVAYFCRIAATSVDLTDAKAGDAFLVASGLYETDDVFLVPKPNLNTIPHLCYVDPAEDGMFGSFKMSGSYNNVNLYADQNETAAPVVSQVEVPVASVYADAESAEDDAASAAVTCSVINDRMRAIARELGWRDPSDAATDATLATALDETEGLTASTAANAVRTRVAITPLDLATRTWGTSDILDFTLPSQATSTLRCDMNDVDFTAVADEETGCILFGLVSCTKPLRRKIVIQEMKEGLFTSALRYKPNTSGHGSVVEVHSNVSDFIGSDHYEWKALPYMLNRTAGGVRTRQFGLAATGMRGQNVIINHFYKSTDNVEGDLDKRVAAWAPTQNSTVNEHLLIPDNDHLMNDNGTFEVLVQPTETNSDAVLVTWRYAGEGDQKGDKGKPIVPADERTTVWSLDTAETGRLLHTPYDFRRAESFTVLGSDKGFAWLERNDGNTETKMYNVRVNGADGTLRDYESPVDLGYPETNGFSVIDAGNMLYGVRIQEGQAGLPGDETLAQLKEIRAANGPIYGNESGFCAVDVEQMIDDLAAGAGAGGAAADEDPSYPVKQYQVIAARWDAHSQRYREFFPYASLDFAPDDSAGFRLAPTGQNAGGTGFFTATIKDIGAQIANLHYAEVTPVPGLQFLSVACFDAFIGEGTWTVHPRVQVANIGNTPISSFTVIFYRKGVEFHRVTLEHLEDYVCDPLRPVHEGTVEAADAADAETAAVAGAETAAGTEEGVTASWTAADDAMIWPGSTRIYSIPLTVDVDLQKGWEKTNPISVDVVDPCVPDLDKKDRQGNLLAELLFDFEKGAEAPLQTMCGFAGTRGQNAFDIETGLTTLGEMDEFRLSDIEKLEGGQAAKTGDGMGIAAVAGAALAGAAAVSAVAAGAAKSAEDADI